MVSGQMVSFDEVKGYGFARPDSGGEDVFVHVNDLDFDKYDLSAGARVQFTVVDGDRGRKASNVTLLEEAPPQTAGAATNGAARHLPGRAELTEMLLREVPSLTGEQILQVRDVLARALRGGSEQ